MTRISACVIVRDEEKNLPQWLRCVKGIADEIVVVDTGSRDNTVEIARQGGARVEHFAWCDDFGAAKNYALDCCRGTWVIMLDADEYFTEKDFPKVRGLIEAHEKELEVLGFLFQRINIDQDNQGAYLDSGPQIRVFRNLPELRYHGRIHENLRYEGQGKGTMVFFPDAVIYHTGYSSSLRREKNLRNLAMLEKEEAEGRGEGMEFYLADCHNGLGNYAEAAKYAERGIRKGLAVAVGDDCRPYQIWIESLMLTGKSREEILSAVEKAKSVHPESARFDFLLGFDAWERRDYLAAEESFARGIALVEGQKERDPLAGTGKEKYLADACCKLAQMAKWRGKEKKAMDWAYRAVREERYNPRALRMFLECMGELPPADAIAVLNSIYDSKGDAPFLARNLDRASERQMRLYYRKQGKMEQGEAEAYWLAGKSMAAAAFLAEEMDALYRLGIWSAGQSGKLSENLAMLLPEAYRKAAERKAETSKQANLFRRMQRLERALCHEEEEESKAVAKLNAILGELLKRNSSQAIAVADRLLDEKPRTLHVLIRLGMVYLMLKDLPKVDKVALLLPSGHPVRKYLHACGLLEKNREEAKRLCLEIVGQGGLPDRLRGREHEMLGVIYHREGCMKEAAREHLAASRLMNSREDRMEKLDCYLMTLHYMNDSPEIIRKETLRCREILSGIHPFSHGARHRHHKLRIGYVSPDFRRNVAANFCQAFFDAFDGERFEVFGYPCCKEDEISRLMAKKANGWRNIFGLGWENAAKLIYGDEIDILMELAGHSGKKTLPIMAYRPAPVQICGIGYFATTGIPAIDYFLVDRNTAVSGEEVFFTEKLLRLPHSHLCYTQVMDPENSVVPLPCERNGFITFGSMSQINRVGDEVLDAWGRIFRALPEARLYLKQRWLDDPQRRKRVWERLEEAGIAPSRVTMEGYTDEFLSSYRHMDIALDTFPYCGGGTTCDALYMGIPVIVMEGNSHHGRFGFSILKNIGLEELCGYTVEEYVACAVNLAKDRARLRRIHGELRGRMEKSVLMDQKLYMKDLEETYEKIWRLYENGGS
ncbi:MAG: glycosyltransferase [Selenomonadaceae bacterium]|nr:glycosyltransferase [Selenomonadaceae bacterium]